MDAQSGGQTVKKVFRLGQAVLELSVEALCSHCANIYTTLTNLRIVVRSLHKLE
jgi:hypothetical protein